RPRTSWPLLRLYTSPFRYASVGALHITSVTRFGSNRSPLTRRLANVCSVPDSSFFLEVADIVIRLVRDRTVVPYGDTIARAKLGGALYPVEPAAKLCAGDAQPVRHAPRRVPGAAPNPRRHKRRGSLRSWPDRGAFGGFRPAGGGERQDLLDQ